MVSIQCLEQNKSMSVMTSKSLLQNLWLPKNEVSYPISSNSSSWVNNGRLILCRPSCFNGTHCVHCLPPHTHGLNSLSVCHPSPNNQWRFILHPGDCNVHGQQRFCCLTLAAAVLKDPQASASSWCRHHPLPRAQFYQDLYTSFCWALFKVLCSKMSYNI